jgi:tripartite-type tricarboxylate transporter receptor subunit TctC
VARLNAEVAKIVGNPDVAKAWRVQGAVPMTMSVAEFTRYLEDDIVKWAHIVKVSGAKPEQ